VADANSTLLNDRKMANAISRIVPRSERQPDLSVLEQTYVETGVLPQLDNNNNQILYGRRGTGKSHVFRVLGAEATRTPDNLQVYIDLRFLGSAQLMTDSTQPMSVRCVSVFRDLLSIIQAYLVDVATDPERETSVDALDRVSELADVVSGSITEIAGRDVALEEAHGQAKSTDAMPS
jgi:hypothetical protein